MKTPQTIFIFFDEGESSKSVSYLKGGQPIVPLFCKKMKLETISPWILLSAENRIVLLFKKSAKNSSETCVLRTTTLSIFKGKKRVWLAKV
jgi:hypothetical protein